MKKNQIYIIDSDVFISAKNSYYAFLICPGFWDGLICYHHAEKIGSIDKVKNELLVGADTEDLVLWVKGLPDNFFFVTDDKEVINAYGKVMLWVQRNRQYKDDVKAKFATEADGWLVAYAMTYDAVVVTNEQSHPESKSRIMLPDVCAEFKVPYKDTFAMLKELNARYVWEDPSYSEATLKHETE